MKKRMLSLLLCLSLLVTLMCPAAAAQEETEITLPEAEEVLLEPIETEASAETMEAETAAEPGKNPEEAEETEDAVETTESKAVYIPGTEEFHQKVTELVEEVRDAAVLEDEELIALQAELAKLRETADLMEEQERGNLEEDLLRLENASVSVNVTLQAREAYRTGDMSLMPENTGENSWRYQNGDRVESGDAQLAVEPPQPSGTEIGIDVSQFQGSVDWDAVKNSGIQFTVIRVVSTNNSGLYIDEQCRTNMEACQEKGIPYGTYVYSYACSTDDARREAEEAVEAMQGYGLSLPVFYDLEDNTLPTQDTALMGQIAKTFCDTVSGYGYKVGIYASKSWWQNILTDDVFNTDYGWLRWVARWNEQASSSGIDSTYIWQCSSDGVVNGISGYVDYDYLYDEVTPVKNGLYRENGVLVYYKNGSVDTTFKGIVSFTENGTTERYLVENGTANLNYSGLYLYDGTWYDVVNGQVADSYTGLVLHTDGNWYYVQNGVLNWSYTGLAQVNNAGDWYYVQGGVLCWGITGLILNDGNGNWYYVRNSILNSSYTGLVQHTDGDWYYVQNGMLNWSYTGLAQVGSSGSWYYVQNGILNWGFTGIAQVNNTGAWYYVQGGVLHWDTTGLILNGDGSWYYIKSGVLDSGYTGLVQHTDQNWYYVQDGKLDWSYTGLAQVGNSGNWYYVRSGVLCWGVTGLVLGTDGKWYNVKNSILDSDYTGLVQHTDGGWYYVKNGVLDWSFTGMVHYTNGSWYYVQNGILDWSFNGIITWDGERYQVTNGVGKLIE